MARKRNGRPYLKGEPPPWPGEFEGWAVNFARQNAWRVAPDFTVEDIIQECGGAFARILNRYPKSLERPQYMALFKRSCWNRLHDLANIKRWRKEAGVPLGGLSIQDGDDSRSTGEILPDLRAADPQHEGMLAAIIANAPEAIRAVIAAARQGQGGYRRLPCGRFETREEVLIRLAGPHQSPTLSEDITAWFSKELGITIG